MAGSLCTAQSLVCSISAMGRSISSRLFLGGLGLGRFEDSREIQPDLCWDSPLLPVVDAACAIGGFKPQFLRQSGRPAEALNQFCISHTRY